MNSVNPDSDNIIILFLTKFLSVFKVNIARLLENLAIFTYFYPQLNLQC